MKFTLNTKKFTQTTSSIVNIFQKSSMFNQAGNDILITSENSSVIIESANQGMYIKATIDSDISEHGSFCVNSNMLTSLKLFGKDITFESAKSGNRINFVCGKFKGQFNTAQSNKTISQRPDNIETDVTIPFEPLKKGMGLVTFSPNAATPILPLSIVSNSSGITLFTFDTTCAAYYNAAYEGLKDINIMIPAQFMSSAFNKFGNTLNIGFSKKIIKLSSSTFEIYHPTKQNFQTFNVVEYYNKLQKQQPALSFKCKASNWIESIEMASSLTAGIGVNDNNLTVKIDQSSIAIVDIASNVGDATSEFELISVDKCEKNTFIISSSTFLDFLNHVKKDEISVSIYPQHGFRKILIENESISYILPLK